MHRFPVFVASFFLVVALWVAFFLSLPAHHPLTLSAMPIR
jgi:hypothetical protein